MTLGDLERLDARGPFFRWISVFTLITFDIYDQIWRGDTYGKGRLSTGSATPHLKGRGLSVSKFLGPTCTWYEKELPNYTWSSN